jgi:hypothetical protein
MGADEEQHAGIFIDWNTGGTLQLTVTASMDWSGTDRHVCFEIGAVEETVDGGPAAWRFVERSRFIPSTWG